MGQRGERSSKRGARTPLPSGRGRTGGPGEGSPSLERTQPSPLSHPGEGIGALSAKSRSRAHPKIGERRCSHVIARSVPGIHVFEQHSPHPEEARSAVSKDDSVRSGASFETQTRSAPQDEACDSDFRMAGTSPAMTLLVRASRPPSSDNPSRPRTGSPCSDRFRIED